MSPQDVRDWFLLLAQNPALLAVALWILRVMGQQHRAVLSELRELRRAIVDLGAAPDPRLRSLPPE